MSGVVTPAKLKAARRQDKHLQTSLILSQRVFDVAERVDGNIFGTKMKLGRRWGCFSDLFNQLQNQNTTTKTFTSQMLSLKTTLKQPYLRSVIHCDPTASLVLLAAPYLKDSYVIIWLSFPYFLVLSQSIILKCSDCLFGFSSLWLRICSHSTRGRALPLPY